MKNFSNKKDKNKSKVYYRQRIDIYYINKTSNIYFCDLKN